MKLNKILLSLLCVPALLSGAAGSEASVQQKKQSVKSLEERALEVFISEAAKRQQLPAMTAQLIETGIYTSKPEEVLSAIYVAWLNANPKAIITGIQTIKEVCRQMRIDTTIFDERDHERIVNIGQYLVPDGPIKELKERPGTIAHLIHTDRISLSNADGKLDLFRQYLTVCDVWNIPNAYSSITYLDLHCNQITAIASGAFTGLSALRHLYLYGNQITAIGSGTFAGLSGLRIINLNGNQITAIDSGAFAGLSALEELYLENNQIKAIAPETFAGLSILRFIDLTRNQITAIGSETFAGLSVLRRLDLTRNQITAIAPETFAGLSVLQRLYLDGNDALQLTKPNYLQSIKGERPEWFAVQAAVAATDDLH